METYVLVIGAILVVVGLFIWFLRRFRSPESTARTCLREYARFEKMGVAESERIFLVLSTRPGWRDLPKEFVREISSRLGTKEDVIRFIIISERHLLDRTHFLRFATDSSPEHAAFSVAMLLTSLGNKLQGQGELGEAEWAQSLALRIQPDNSAVMLPLAVTYYLTGRYTEAIPLFERGLPLFTLVNRRSQTYHSTCLSTSIPRNERSCSGHEKICLNWRSYIEKCMTNV